MIEQLLENVKNTDICLLFIYYAVSLCLIRSSKIDSTDKLLEIYRDKLNMCYKRLSITCDAEYKDEKRILTQYIDILNNSVFQEKEFMDEIQNCYTTNALIHGEENSAIIYGRLNGNKPEKYTKFGFLYFLHEEFNSFKELINIANESQETEKFIKFINSFYLT